MQSLQVRTGEIKLQILDDAGEERGIFKFNPTDIESAKKVLSFQAELNSKQVEFEEQAKKCETPEEKINLLDEVCTYFNNLIDECFGAGSSQLLFGGAKTLSMYDDFIQGIIPYYQKASKDRVAKYSPKKTSK
mgnify:CR=1 FL=1